jgi:hypothetical protein
MSSVKLQKTNEKSQVLNRKKGFLLNAFLVFTPKSL